MENYTANPFRLFLHSYFTLFLMMKNTLYPLMILLATFFVACQPSNQNMENAEAVQDRSAQEVVTGGKPSENLRANAIKAGDFAKQAEWSLGLIQEQLKKSAGKVNGLGEVSILLDDNFQMAIRNNYNGEMIEKRVSLANLDTDIKNIEIISDSHGHPNPGLKFKVLDGKPGVEVYKDGSKTETLKELELIFAERKMVHKAISAMTNAVNASRGIVHEE
jgi:hypothetical protein